MKARRLGGRRPLRSLSRGFCLLRRKEELIDFGAMPVGATLVVQASLRQGSWEPQRVPVSDGPGLPGAGSGHVSLGQSGDGGQAACSPA